MNRTRVGRLVATLVAALLAFPVLVTTCTVSSMESGGDLDDPHELLDALHPPFRVVRRTHDLDDLPRPGTRLVEVPAGGEMEQAIETWIGSMRSQRQWHPIFGTWGGAYEIYGSDYMIHVMKPGSVIIETFFPVRGRQGQWGAALDRGAAEWIALQELLDALPEDDR